MHKESLCDNCSTNSYLKVCDLQSALNSSDSHPHSCKHTRIQRHMQQTLQEMHFFKLPNTCHVTRSILPVHFLLFIRSHYSQIAYWILNIVFTLRLIEAFCFQTVSCNIFKQRKRSTIHCLQPESVISTTAEMETMCSMQTEFISKLLSLSLLRRRKKYKKCWLRNHSRPGNSQRPDHTLLLPKANQNLHRKQRKSSETTILWEIIVTSIPIWHLGMHGISCDHFLCCSAGHCCDFVKETK